MTKHITVKEAGPRSAAFTRDTDDLVSCRADLVTVPVGAGEAFISDNQHLLIYWPDTIKALAVCHTAKYSDDTVRAYHAWVEGDGWSDIGAAEYHDFQNGVIPNIEPPVTSPKPAAKKAAKKKVVKK